MTVAALVTGSVLLVAAALKLIGWNVSPFAQYGWLLSPTVQAVAIIWETLLGLWLFTRKNQFLAWLAAVVTFATFAVISGYLGVIGQATCGCLGVVRASPWAAFAVDVTMLGMLALGRPEMVTRGDGMKSLRWGGSVGTLFAVLAGSGVLAFGSLDAAIAKLRGESLVASPSTIDFGTGRPGQVLSSEVTIYNYSSSPVRLVGGTSDCSCITTRDMPLTIAPWENVTIRVTLKVPPEGTGQMSRWIELYTDCSQQQRIHIVAGCLIEE